MRASTGDPLSKKKSVRVKATGRRMIDVEKKRGFQPGILGWEIPYQMSRKEAKALAAQRMTARGKPTKPEQLRTTRFHALWRHTNPTVAEYVGTGMGRGQFGEPIRATIQGGSRSRRKQEVYVVAKKATRKRVR